MGMTEDQLEQEALGWLVELRSRKIRRIVRRAGKIVG
jgi:hypothetical protein